MTATDNVGVTGYLITETSTKPSSAATGWSTTPLVSYSFTTEGSKILYAWAKDQAGNVSSSKSATTIVTLLAAPIVGDLNGDRAVNSLDYALLLSVWGQNYPAYDLNHDGSVNSLDYTIMLLHWTI